MQTPSDLPEIERAALLLLSGCYPLHPIVNQWVRTLTDDRHYAKPLDEHEFFDEPDVQTRRHAHRSEDILAWCRQVHLHTGPGLEQAVREQKALPPIDTEWDRKSYWVNEGGRRRALAEEAAIAGLASALVTYRAAGRPAKGGSLATAIVEFDRGLRHACLEETHWLNEQNRHLGRRIEAAKSRRR